MRSVLGSNIGLIQGYGAKVGENNGSNATGTVVYTMSRMPKAHNNNACLFRSCCDVILEDNKHVMYKAPTTSRNIPEKNKKTVPSFAFA